MSAHAKVNCQQATCSMQHAAAAAAAATAT